MKDNKIIEFIDFINNSSSAYHAVENIENLLKKAGFEELNNKKIQLGKSYYKKRKDAAIIAFRVPLKLTNKINIVSSHSDSPCFKLKANPTIYKKGYTLLNVSGYGGMIYSSFMDKPLSLAGRVCYLDEANEVCTKLIDYKVPITVMANLAIHLNREVNSGYAYTPGKDLLPILSLGETDLLSDIREKFDIKGEIISHDIFVYSCTKGYVLGANDEFISSPRLDDLECAYTATKALISSTPTHLSLSCVFNNEEVGSGSYNGANSDFLTVILTQIKEDLELSDSELFNMLENSFAISADNAHALHPNHLEKYDLDNSPKMNEGVVIKFSANQKYTTEASSAAKFIKLCKLASTPYQVYENHSNIAGGSTLGNILNAQVSISSIDIGLAQLAMHSAVELGGVKDLSYLEKTLVEYFNN